MTLISKPSPQLKQKVDQLQEDRIRKDCNVHLKRIRDTNKQHPAGGGYGGKIQEAILLRHSKEGIQLSWEESTKLTLPICIELNKFEFDIKNQINVHQEMMNFINQSVESLMLARKNAE